MFTKPKFSKILMLAFLIIKFGYLKFSRVNLLDAETVCVGWESVCSRMCLLLHNF